MTSNLLRPRALVAFLFAAFIVGCVTSQVVAPLLVPPVRAGTNPARWEYLCAEVHDAKALQTWANGAGAQGWELAASAGAGWGYGSGSTLTSAKEVNLIWCFKRQRP
jgi:hypothetical protein